MKATSKESNDGRLVKVTYGSKKKSGGIALGKKLFGYKSWNVKAGDKEYVHKPIVGSLQRLPVVRIGRSKFIAPEEKLQDIEDEIERNGGKVRRMEAVTMDEKEVERKARDAYRAFIDPLIAKMKFASKTQNKEVYASTLESGMRMTNFFEKFLKELDDYGSPFVKKEEQRESEFLKRMRALEDMASEDFEAAKIQTEFFTAELENLRDQILK